MHWQKRLQPNFTKEICLSFRSIIQFLIGLHKNCLIYQSIPDTKKLSDVVCKCGWQREALERMLSRIFVWLVACIRQMLHAYEAMIRDYVFSRNSVSPKKKKRKQEAVAGNISICSNPARLLCRNEISAHRIFHTRRTFHGSSHFETTRKNPSTAPRGMMINYRAENMDPVLFLKKIWSFPIEIGVLEMCVPNIIIVIQRSHSFSSSELASGSKLYSCITPIPLTIIFICFLLC